MKVKVKRYFADAYTGQQYAKGDTYTGTPERIAELRGAGVLEAGEVEDGVSTDERQGESPAPGKPAGGTGSAGRKDGSGTKRAR